MADARSSPAPEGATGVLVLADGSAIWGRGFGAEGDAVGEVCFNTAMTGYQEVMTDPSYASQIVTFTFPHIGNVGVLDRRIHHAKRADPALVAGLHRLLHGVVDVFAQHGPPFGLQKTGCSHEPRGL